MSDVVLESWRTGRSIRETLGKPLPSADAVTGPTPAGADVLRPHLAAFIDLDAYLTDQGF